MKIGTIETFGVKVVSQYTDNIIDMIFKYVENDPSLKEEFLQLEQEYGAEVVKRRFTNLIANHFGVNSKKKI